MNNLNPTFQPTAHVVKYDGRTGEVVQERDIISPCDLYLQSIRSLWPVFTMEPDGNGGIDGSCWRSFREHAAGEPPVLKFNLKRLDK